MNIGKIIAGMGLLIGIFLVVSNADKSANIIKTIGDASTGTIKTLQGRG
jgi:hypothetical protein